MPDTMIWAGTAMAVTAMLCIAALKGWRSWIELRRFEISAAARSQAAELPPGGRIEIAHVKERLRKLEAIARGVDL